MKNRKSRKESQSLSAAFNRWNAMFLLAGLALGVVLFWVMLPSSALRAEARAGTGAGVMTHKWGELKVTPISLERPAELAALDPETPREIRWFFHEQSPTTLRAFFLESGLIAVQVEALLHTNSWSITSNGVWITPSLALVRDMPPSTRERVYRLLARSIQNSGPYRHPYRPTGATVADWFAGTELPNETLALIEKLTFVRNGGLCFSDVEYLQLQLPKDQMATVSRVLSRVQSALVYVRITPQTDIKALMKYWGTRSRSEKVKPLVESLTRVPEGGWLNVSWFLPPVPRLLVYSFPNQTNAVNGRLPDCGWTALNFFNEEADDRFLDEAADLSILGQKYGAVEKAEEFGDLIIMYEREGKDMVVEHMCVFIADDIVFTKNGADPRQPWVFMRLPEVMAGYGSEKPVQVACLRPRAK